MALDQNQLFDDQDLIIGTHYQTELPPGYYIGNFFPKPDEGITEVHIHDTHHQFFDSFDIPEVVTFSDWEAVCDHLMMNAQRIVQPVGGWS